MTPGSAATVESAVRIRRAEPADARAVGRLFLREARFHRDLTRTFELAESFDWETLASGLITGRGSHIVVAEAPAEIVGFAYGRLLVGGPTAPAQETSGLRSLWRRIRGIEEAP